MTATRQFVCMLLSLLLGSPVFASQSVPADEHVVSATEFHQQLKIAADGRADNLARVNRFFSDERIRGALQSAHLDSREIRQAAATLSDEEISRLAARTGQIERDLAAGALSNEHLTYIVIALATAVIILVIVAAH